MEWAKLNRSEIVVRFQFLFWYKCTSTYKLVKRSENMGIMAHNLIKLYITNYEHTISTSAICIKHKCWSWWALSARVYRNGHRITIIQINVYSLLVGANVGIIKTSTSFRASLQPFCCNSFVLCSATLWVFFLSRFNFNFEIIIIIFCIVQTFENCTKRMGAEGKREKFSFEK